MLVLGYLLFLQRPQIFQKICGLLLFMYPDDKSLAYIERIIRTAVSQKVSRAFGGDDCDNSYAWVDNIYHDHVVVYCVINGESQLKKLSYTWEGDTVVMDDIENGEIVQRADTEYEKPVAIKGKTTLVKSISEDTVGGYGILFGDSKKRDLHGNWFTEETEGYLSTFRSMGSIPYYFHHGADEDTNEYNGVGYTVIGEVVKMGIDDVGVWYEAKIKEHDLYRQKMLPLIEEEALHSSSGTLPLVAKAYQNGEIAVWPIAEMSGTHLPAEPRMLFNGIVRPVNKSSDNDVVNADSGKGAEDARQLVELQQTQFDLVQSI